MGPRRPRSRVSARPVTFGVRCLSTMSSPSTQKGWASQQGLGNPPRAAGLCSVSGGARRAPLWRQQDISSASMAIVRSCHLGNIQGSSCPPLASSPFPAPGPLVQGPCWMGPPPCPLGQPRIPGESEEGAVAALRGHQTGLPRGAAPARGRQVQGLPWISHGLPNLCLHHRMVMTYSFIWESPDCCWNQEALDASRPVWLRTDCQRSLA